ncbi:MAG: STAS domain-containing protein [Phycisphaerae bacterium]|nr:STAS domain-containing protein [Phycisphaerae bacterium]
MELNVEIIDGVAVVKLPFTQLDSGNCEELEILLTQLLERNSKVLLDMDAIRFADSSGVGTLLACIRATEGMGGKLRICNPTVSVRMALDLIHIHRLVDVVDNRTEALAAFAGENSAAML